MVDAAFSAADARQFGAEPTRDDLDIVYEQLEVWSRDKPAHDEWAGPATKAVNYIENKQWEPEVARLLDAEGRPRLTINRIRPRFDLLVGYHLQNQADIRYMPASDAAATNEIAAALTHTAKQIDEANQATWTESEVFIDGLSSGRGYFHTELDFKDNQLGTVKLRSCDPFAVYLDCDAGSYDISEHNHVTMCPWMSLEEMAIRFGGRSALEVGLRGTRRTVAAESELADIGEDISPDSLFGLRGYLRDAPDRFAFLGRMPGTTPIDHVDRQRKLFRVLVREHKQLKSVRLAVDTQTGDKKILPDHWDHARISEVWQAMSAQGFQLAIMTGNEHVWRTTVTCMDVKLWDDWSPYERPSLIGFFPYFRRGVTRGFADDLLDAQDEINKRRSALIHAIMTNSNPGWIWEQGTLSEDMKVGIEREGARPGINIEWVRAQPGSQPPRRIESGSAPQGLRLLTDKAEDDLEDISGVNKSALGEIDRVQSGRAIENRQRQTIIAHERAFSNLKRSRELRGRQMLEMIQGWYTQQRLIRTIGQNGQEMRLMINEMRATGEIANDLTIGRYKVAIDETPTSATFLSAQFAEGIELIREKVFPAQVLADILVDSSSLPRKDEIKGRLQALTGMAPGGAPQGALPAGAQAPGSVPGAPGGAQPMAGPGAPPMVPPMAAPPMAPQARPRRAPPMPGNPIAIGPSGMPIQAHPTMPQ